MNSPQPISDPDLLAKLNAKSKPVSDPAILAKLSSTASKPAKPKEPELDSEAGLPFTDRVALASSDTKEEGRAYLESVYGADNVKVIRHDTTQTYYPGGARRTGGPPRQIAHSEDVLAVKIGGKWVNSEGGGTLKGIAADLISTSPELMLMGAGAVEGSAVGPVGTIAGAAAGAMAGKTIEEGIKKATGRYHLTPGQYAAAVTQSGEAAATGQLGGEAVNRVVGRVAKGGLPRMITGTTDEAKDRFLRLKAEGARPPIAATAPDLKKLQRIEILANKISGQPLGRNKANQVVADKLAARVLIDGGMDKATAQKALVDMANGHEAIPTEAVGDAIRTRVQAHQEMLERQASTAMTAATEYVDKQAGHFNALVRAHPAGALGVDVSEGISASRKAFSTAASKVYSRVDEMVGNRPIVSAKPLQQTAVRLLRGAAGMQPTGQATQASKVVQKLFEDAGLDPALFTNPDARLTLAQAQRARSIFREQASAVDLTPGVTRHEIGQLADALERAISTAAVDANNAPAIKLLRQADKWYGENIKKFNDVQINQLVARVRESGFTADPEQVARLVVQSGESARAIQIKGLLGSELWSRVASQDVDNLLTDATDPLTGELDGPSLAGAIAKRGNVMGVVHGPAETARMMTFARNLAATQGKLASDKLTEPAFKALMQEYEAAQADVEEFVKRDPVAALANTKRRPEEIYNILTKPGNGDLLAKTMYKIGIDSTESRELRKVALQKILFDSVYEAHQIGPEKSYIKGQVTDVLDQYTKREQELLFPDGLVDHLRQFALDLHFLFPKPTDEAMAGMTAGSILNKPAITLGIPRMLGGKGLISGRWLMQVEASLGRYIIDHPGFQEYLTVGRQRGAKAARNDAARLNLVRFFALESFNGVYDEDQQ